MIKDYKVAEVTVKSSVIVPTISLNDDVLTSSDVNTSNDYDAKILLDVAESYNVDEVISSIEVYKSSLD